MCDQICSLISDHTGGIFMCNGCAGTCTFVALHDTDVYRMLTVFYAEICILHQYICA